MAGLGRGQFPRCPSCNGTGTGRVSCFCSRWSDGDIGCQTCAGSGRMAPAAPFLFSSLFVLPNVHILNGYYNPHGTVPNSFEAVQVDEEQGQVRQQERQQQQPGPQRLVDVRRFRIAIEIDLFLILKLAAVIFLFYQDGSRQKLFLLVFSASLIYLYQTGALAPLIQWMSRGMQRAVAPPQPPRPTDVANNIPAAARLGIENASLAGKSDVSGTKEDTDQEDACAKVVVVEYATTERVMDHNVTELRTETDQSQLNKLEAIESFLLVYSNEICSMCDLEVDTNPQDACYTIAGESYKLWLQKENRTDDITIIIVHIKGLCNV